MSEHNHGLGGDVEICACEGRSDTTPGYHCSMCVALGAALHEQFMAAMNTPIDASVLYGPKVTGDCKCGHGEAAHNGPIGDCQERCLCDICPDDTGNDCWCASYKLAAAAGVGGQ